MRYVALAAGYDGTLARDGRGDQRCVEALRSLAATGRKLILVTCRELRDLLEIFPEARVFDYLIAECGAVMHRPATRESAILGQAPSEVLVQELRRRRMAPLSVGSSILTTDRANETEIRDIIAKLHVDAQLVTNGDDLIVLPAGVNEASGMRAALRELGLSAHNLAAIGGTQNDLALLMLAEYSVAVQNAESSLKRCANGVTHSSHCDGFIEFSRELMASDFASVPVRQKLVLGVRHDLAEVSIEPCKETVLVCGPADSGKSALCAGLLQQLLRQKYQCCVIGTDVNGSYALLSGIVPFGDAHEIPRLTDVLNALEQPNASVAINLAALPTETRPVFVDALLLQLQALHDRVGRPHAILVDQAHGFFGGSTAMHPAPRLRDVTMIYSSSDPASMPRQILSNLQVVVALGGTITDLEELCELTDHALPDASQLSLARGHALLWMRQREATEIQLRTSAESAAGMQAPSSETEMST